jgi:hypothetical protein
MLRTNFCIGLTIILLGLLLAGCGPSPEEPSATTATPTITTATSIPIPTIPTPTSAPEIDDTDIKYYEIRENKYTPIRYGLWWNDAALIDFNSDGALDLLVIHVDVDTWEPTPLRILMNDGRGNFSDVTRQMFPEQEIYSIGTNYILIADFNGDGRDDAYFVDQGQDREPWGGNRNTMLIQTADGRLEDETNQRIPNVNNFTHDAAAADIDGDGDVDIFNCNVYGGESGATIYINDGQGYFSDEAFRLPASLVTLDKKFTSSEFIDIDNDGDMDLALGSHGGSLPSEKAVRDTILINDGIGNFVFSDEEVLPERYGGATWGVNEMEVGDVDGDGFPDLIMSVHNSYQTFFLQLLLNNHNGTFRDATDLLPQDQLQAVFRIELADLNGDEKLDILVADDRQFKLYINAGEAGFIDATHILTIDRTDLRPILPGDLDNDGDIDLLILTLESHYYVALSNKPYEIDDNN